MPGFPASPDAQRPTTIAGMRSWLPRLQFGSAANPRRGERQVQGLSSEGGRPCAWDAAKLPTAAEALPGRVTPMPVQAYGHLALGAPLEPPFPDGCERAMFGLGCFWGAERCFWQLEGVHTTAVGYAGGFTPNPTYEEVCTGQTGHAEAVLVVYSPSVIAYEQLLKVFWEVHDPTHGMRQGPDIGNQYRSCVYTFTAQQHAEAAASRDRYQQKLSEAGYGTITTEILEAPEFYYAEEYHQQYLVRHPDGYCHHGLCQAVYDTQIEERRGERPVAGLRPAGSRR